MIIEDNTVYMAIHNPHTSPHPNAAKSRLYLGPKLGRAMDAACASAKKNLTWTWYGNVAQANEVYSLSIEKITLDN